ncbi:putative disease resistance RPP13-like protein 1 [Pistacia vera]|uniref:putative disease resistance RPP13-like protein 1 n=1 Tax=Pistacia vera TaxID=55513 RepID=UPI0012632C70|nr:putative disease resistance RPP13-like protein 1 [Pistacia vera]
MVLRDEVSDHANFSVIPIIGTEGVGKTTLTRLVYDDKAVEDFKPRAWLSLYEDSNVFRISKAILESITSKSCSLKDLDEVLAQLEEAIFGRKFLFVLGDVSTENYGLWETLKSSFMAGAPAVCFMYCAILPDDYEFEEKELVLLWIAECLIGEAQGDERIEDIGGKFFQELLKRCLFQHSSSHASKYRMHDLVKIMARWIYGETEYSRSDDVLGVNEQREEFKKTSHSDTSARSDEKNIFKLFYDVDNLRTFVPGLISNNDNHHITDALLSDLLPKSERLRALSLATHSITKLPSLVEGLRYLRYVNLSSTMIRTLPDSICLLPILQILLLRDCSHLVELPSNLRKLINLWYLDITGVNLLREMPLGMKELTCLRTLLNFIVGKGVGSDLKDLEDLKFLGELYVSRLQNATGSQDTKDSILKDKKALKVLVLEWDFQLDDTRDELVEENVLGTLQPYQNLKELTIKGYTGTRFSSWLGDSTYSKIVVLTLKRCERCRVLPSLGCLGLLEHLTIKGITGIKRIGSELFGKDCSSPFKSLKTLCFEDLKELENWDPVEENEHVEIFPCLRMWGIRGFVPKPLTVLRRRGRRM